MQVNKRWVLLTVVMLVSWASFAQDARVTARMDAGKITVGDRAHLFIEVHNNPSTGKIQWPVLADSVNHLEIVEREKIDTQQQGGFVIYRQKLHITGFDSGLFVLPSLAFTVVPNAGKPYTIQTDSFQLLVQTVAVDTTQAFKPIKNIIPVTTTWRDYIGYIAGGALLLLLGIGIAIYFMRRKRPAPAPKPAAPAEPLQQKTIRRLNELDKRELWQKGQVKEYYVELTSIVREYIEGRFQTPAMELTTDELLSKAKMNKEMQPNYEALARLLHTADLAKFAKWQPSPQEHIDAMESSKNFVNSSRPKIPETPTEKKL